MTAVSIIYPTCRKHSRVDWLFDALWYTQTAKNFIHQLIIVDDYAEDEGRKEEFLRLNNDRFPYKHVAPKPCVWRGKHRLTAKNHFAAGNARNTGVCYARHSHLVFIDDTGIPLDGWLDSHLFAAKGRYALAGSRSKAVFEVENGRPINITSLDNDSRGVLSKSINSNIGENVDSTFFHEIHSNNFSVPLDSFLHINGFDEKYDGQYGVEDCDLSIRLCRNGLVALYDPDCPTLEHKQQGLYMETKEGSKMKAKRLPCNGITDAQGRNRHANESLIFHHDPERSVADFSSLEADRQRFLPLGNPFNLRELRASILDDGEFPIIGLPTHDWRDGQPLTEMKD